MNEPVSAHHGAAASKRSSAFGLAVGPIFLVVAAVLWIAPAWTTIPAKHPVPVDARRITTEPRRVIIGDPPKIVVNNFERVCTDCHGIFPLSQQQIENRLQHPHVRLEHGINDACHNCHDIRDMNRLVLRNGDSISYTDVPELCRKCHGVTFRDWEHGIHGRTNGYWDPTRGEARRLRCIECHDPHRPRTPAMDPLAPLPGPDTLRMGDPHAASGDREQGEEADPLRRVLMPATTDSERKEHR